MRFGLPRGVTSDQGRKFNNELNSELAKKLGIDHRLTIPYHLQVCTSQALLHVYTCSISFCLGKWIGRTDASAHDCKVCGAEEGYVGKLLGCMCFRV